MKIVVDTNIVFSAILNTGGTIGDLIFNSHNLFKFYSCYFLYNEINNHRDKLKRISKLNDSELYETERFIYKQIRFIASGQITKNYRLKAFELVKDIDLKDIIFVSLNEQLNSILWTRDKVLINGLRKKGYNKIVSTNELLKIRQKIERR